MVNNGVHFWRHRKVYAPSRPEHKEDGQKLAILVSSFCGRLRLRYNKDRVLVMDAFRREQEGLALHNDMICQHRVCKDTRGAT